MRWIPWALGLAGVAQHALVALLKPEDYISLDTSYLVMWLAVIGALVVCHLDCGDCYDGGACDCCPDHCHCGDCEACSQEHDH
jgi:hypothetical protein